VAGFGGGGVVAFSSKDPDVASTPGIIEFGFELRSPHPWRWVNSSLVPLFGASFSSLQATSWSLNGSLEGGVEWSRPGSDHRVRLLAVAQRGASPFSQFFFDKTQNIGVQLQFEF
jgi:hypothetical protein